MQEILAVISKWLLANIWELVGISGIGALLGIVLRKWVPKDALTKRLDGFLIKTRKSLDDWMRAAGPGVRLAGRRVGRVLTLNISRWPAVGIVYNKLLEPYIILLLELVVKISLSLFDALTTIGAWAVNSFTQGVKAGLLSDNPSFAGQLKSEKKDYARDKD